MPKSAKKSGKKSVKKSVRKSCKGMRVKHRKISGWQKKIGGLMRSAAMKQKYPSATERLVASVAKAKGKKLPVPKLVRNLRSQIKVKRSKARK